MLTRQIPIVLLLTIALFGSWPDSRTNWTVATAQELDYEEEFSKGRDLFRCARQEVCRVLRLDRVPTKFWSLLTAIVSLCSDSNEEEWKEFTEKNKMIWPQYRDKDRLIQRAFGVRAFPTYIVIDHEGIVRFQSVGMSWTSSADLGEAIRKQIKIVAKSTEAR